MKVKNILVAQAQPSDSEKSPYNELIKKYGVSIEFQNFISIEGIGASAFRKEKINILDHTAILFTSRNAVDHFFCLSKEMRLEIPDTMKYFCNSESTAFYLQKYIQYRKRKIFYGSQNYFDLLEIIKKHKDEKFLLPSSDSQLNDLPKLLDENNIKYTKAIIYKTIPSNLTSLKIDKYDLIIFFSPSGIKSLLKNFPKFKQKNTLIAAFGPSTAAALKEAEFKVNIQAPTKTAPSMTMAIAQYLQEVNKKK